jgi:triphosphoribosyl-dephospho-CoA synthase
MRAKSLIASASVAQTRFIYEAIGLAKPGGMGAVPEADVAATSPLRDSDTVAHVMALAADRDSIAAEYVSGYALTFERTVPSLLGLLSSGCGLQWAIVGTYLRLLAENPDTLIARKVGWERARQISVWAGQLVDEFFPQDLPDWAKADREEACEQSLGDLDFALRSDANRLNPGTTADLIAAGLLVATLAGKISQPIRW